MMIGVFILIGNFPAYFFGAPVENMNGKDEECLQQRSSKSKGHCFGNLCEKFPCASGHNQHGDKRENGGQCGTDHRKHDF